MVKNHFYFKMLVQNQLFIFLTPASTVEFFFFQWDLGLINSTANIGVENVQ